MDMIDGLTGYNRVKDIEERYRKEYSNYKEQEEIAKKLNISYERSMFCIESLKKDIVAYINSFTVVANETIEKLKYYSFVDSDGIVEVGEILNNSKLMASFCGVGLSLGTYTLTSVFGTASTGTAIATLSGQPLTNATLACIGGGSIATGGGGMATGVGVLGAIAIAPVLLMEIAGNNKEVEKYKKEITKIKKLSKKLNSNIENMKEFLKYAEVYKEVLKSLKREYFSKIEDAIERFDKIEDVNKEIIRITKELIDEIKSYDEEVTNILDRIESLEIKERTQEEIKKDFDRLINEIIEIDKENIESSLDGLKKYELHISVTMKKEQDRINSFVGKAIGCVVIEVVKNIFDNPVVDCVGTGLQGATALSAGADVYYTIKSYNKITEEDIDILEAYKKELNKKYQNDLNENKEIRIDKSLSKKHKLTDLERKEYFETIKYIARCFGSEGITAMEEIGIKVVATAVKKKNSFFSIASKLGMIAIGETIKAYTDSDFIDFAMNVTEGCCALSIGNDVYKIYKSYNEITKEDIDALDNLFETLTAGEEIDRSEDVDEEY